MMDVARMIEWHPAFGLDRELDWLTNMHDWLISKKNRYWGLALPIYECPKCGNFEVIGGYDELKERAVSGWSEFEGHTPHKPYIDDVKIKCDKCGEIVSRVDDVGNVWLDAGIVPFSTYVDPVTKKLSYITDKKYWEQWFPADFITESFPGQFKNWFYSMIAMATVLEKRNPYKRVLGYGSMLGEDGRPMHKSWGNAIEFNEGADKIGVDVMRWMFAMHDPEQNLLFGYKKADETRRSFHLLLWNVYNFFVTYALTDGFKPADREKPSENVLDVWILSKLNGVIRLVTGALEAFDAFTAAHAINDFVTDLSQWYVRRSRSRVGPSSGDAQDRLACHRTLYKVLTELSLLLEPFTPFFSEELYTNLTDGTSVHLSVWPEADGNAIDTALEERMTLVRQIVERLHAGRKEAGIAVRQPLASAEITGAPSLPEEFRAIIRDETNIKAVNFVSGGDNLSVTLNTELTPELKAEGRLRDLVRKIQLLRKEKGCKIDEHVRLALPEEYKSFPGEMLDVLKIETLADELVWGDGLSLLTG